MKHSIFIAGLFAIAIGGCGNETAPSVPSVASAPTVTPPATAPQQRVAIATPPATAIAPLMIGGDVLKIPTILINPNIDVSKVTYKGLALDTPRAAVPRSLIKTEGGAAGVARDGFDTAEGDIILFKLDKIDRINIGDPKILSVLGIAKREDIEKVFGTPSSVENRHSIDRYHYRQRNITVSWNNTDDKLNGVMIHHGDLDGFK